MSKRELTVFLIGIVCGSAVVACAMPTIRPLLRASVLATNEESRGAEETSPGSPTPKLTYALDGYCPVTLINKWQWTMGSIHYRETRGTQVFLFAGPAEQELFKGDPDRYLPALSGNDVVLAKEKNETRCGKIEHGMMYDEQIYLFATEETLQRFVQNPRLYDTASRDDQLMPAVSLP